MFFDRLDPSDIDPRHLVGRDRDQRWVREILTRYLRLDGEPTGRALCVTGEKGVGKSILTRKVLSDLRTEFSANTLFLTIDCRACHERRGVLAAVANEVVRELDSLRRATAVVPEPLLASAQLLRALSRFDDVELSMAHEQTRQFKLAASLPGPQVLLSTLKLNFGLSMELNDKQSRALTGSVKFDDLGICEALIALFRDIRAAGFQLLLYLDNIDELRHDYHDEAARQSVRRDVEGVLLLKAAPIGLILNMRKYYTGVVPREISNIRVLRSLDPDTLCAILARRLEREREEARAHLRAPAVDAVVRRLAAAQPTALAFLRWVKFLFEEELLTESALTDGFDYFLESNYSNVEVETLRAVAASFEGVDRPLDASKVLAACDNNHAFFEQIQDRQVVLPRDFWNPTQFTLDPELVFLHPSCGLL